MRSPQFNYFIEESFNFGIMNQFLLNFKLLKQLVSVKLNLIIAATELYCLVPVSSSILVKGSLKYGIPFIIILHKF